MSALLSEMSPQSDSFMRCYERGESQLLWLSLAADLQTPVAAYLKLTADDDEKAMSYLLESVEGGETRGRYSFIACRPDVIWRYEKGEVSINREALSDADKFHIDERSPLDSLKSLLAEIRLKIPTELHAMACSLGGYLAYDCIRTIENIPDNNEDFMQLPDGIFMRPSLIAVFDNATDTLYLVTPVFYDESVSAARAYEAGTDRLMRARALLESPLPALSCAAAHPMEQAPEPLSVSCNMDDADYETMVERAKEYIAAGDIFQVVLSRRYCIENFTASPFSLYRSLRRTNPSPYMFYLNFGSFQVVGSSPEILVQLQGDGVTIRPIAGTRRRGATESEDLALADELLADEKERAEHLMLLDLGRNDCGRVSRIGSVRVTDSFFIERYSHVMHIVSNVEGDLDRERYDTLSALMAGFPAGTVSGAPKIRAMEIIDELESQKRGIYSGCIGHFSANGDVNSCIVLRVAIIKDGKVYVQAGAGVVADSSPSAEAQECFQKARAILAAAEGAHRYEDHYGGGNY